MWNIRTEFDTCRNQLERLGLQPTGTISITLNSRAKGWWYKCHKEGSDHFSIQFNPRILLSTVPQQTMRSILCAALIHTLPQCFRFGKTWQAIAEMLNDAYGYSICRSIDIPEAAEHYAVQNRKSVTIEKIPQERQLRLSPGDLVCHAKHGQGIVSSIRPIGNDMLLTITFQSCGILNLMQKSAVLSLQKIETLPGTEKEGGSNGQ